MAFVGYDKETKLAFGVYNTELEALNSGGARTGTLAVAEYDWQETDYLPSMTVSDDGVVSNRFPGKTIDEQRALIEAEDDQKKIDIEIKFKTEAIKMTARVLLEEMQWQERRARDTDLVNGNNDAMNAYRAKRNLVRTESNEAEAKLNALTTIEELRAFQAKEQFS
tara:strand:- start:1329 stop:1826 length:498 start_codon:yes stop_codon:yes gene_type:complete